MITTNQKTWKLWYDKPAARWEEALPLGNGRLGAMVFGGIQNERIQLNEDTLWSGTVQDKTNYEAYDYLQEARQLIFEGKYAEAEQLIEANMVGEDGEAYQPLGDLYIDHHFNGTASNYKRELSLNTGIAKTECTVDEAHYTRETFISNPHQVLAVRIQANQPSIHISAYLGSLLQHTIEEAENQVTLRGRSPISVKVPNQIEYDEHDGIQFIVCLQAITNEGTITVQNNKIEISDTDSVLLLLTANTNFTKFNEKPDSNLEKMSGEAYQWLKTATQSTFDQLLDQHIQAHGQLFSRMDIHLGESNHNHLPTDVRLQQYKSEKNDPELEALYFQYGRYLLLTSSLPGTQAANLQGIWNQSVQPPWNCDYTTNINVEMNYWPAEVCNLSECHQPLFDMIEDLSQSGEKTASELYGARGWAVHHNVDLWRMSTPSSGQASWAFWPLAGAWLTSHIWEHYLFTRDHQFLRDKAYPLMKGAAEFFLDWLIEGPNGYLVTNPSTSPENKFLTNEGQPCSVSFASTMDMTLIRELFSNCIEACGLLSIDEEFCEQVKAAKKRLVPFQINDKGRIQEWFKDFPEYEPGHRHLSHLYGLYPGNQINPFQTAELMHAARKSLEARIEKGGGHTGWSCAWLINLFARLQDGEQAYLYIQTLLARSTHTNLFDDHPPFQIDGNFGGTAGIAEMLVQSHLGGIDLLPALPKKWASGYIRGIRARGGYIIHVEWENHRLKKAEIVSTRSGECQVRYSHAPLKISKSDGTVFEHPQTFFMEENEKVMITIHSM
ncbi:alpha-L-fucosidase 2 [Neobacillus bataviensis]|uniref:Alpha-L-fucosidase 2 n=1 Tax=Neobacillus bataviensis TaxID=220685 RepID=A0A561DEY0_9BACI|nr:glycoside hydrolase family 95 protein [Neobacillus bataviensis]TWE01868.1 alpha-L-fucosidase 2 [Neobacillus bataviensis]